MGTHCALVRCFAVWVLLVVYFSEALLARIPGRNVFDVRVGEGCGKSIHDGILAASVTKTFQRSDQVVLLLSAQIWVNWLDALPRWTMTGLTYHRLGLSCSWVAG